MKCVICKNGDTKKGRTTVVLERGGATVIIKDVPANICDTCGEYYLSKKVTAKVMKLAEGALRHGVEIEILRYAA